MMAEVLRYSHVDIDYKGVSAVKDMNFSLNEGEILGIVGESGSGKSTVIKAAMGLLGIDGCVTRGDIFYGETNLTNLTDKQMQKINGPEVGMIFQAAGATFCPIRTVGAHLYEMMREHQGKISKKEFSEKAQQMLRTLGFNDPERILKSYPFELSGGMQQRVGIAAAMLPGPKVLLADEPTSALDVSIQKQVVEELKLVREKFGTAIILVTHNIGVIEALADAVLVMKDGQTVEYGSKDQVINHPQMDYTRKLMKAVPRLKR